MPGNESCYGTPAVEPSPIPPTAPTPLPARASGATLANIIGWPAVVLLAGGYLVLIGRLTSFPFEDFPAHLARASVLADLIFHHGEQWGRIFAFHFQPVPYLLHDLILTSLVAALGTTVGGAVFNELVALSLPCALLYYMHVNRLSSQARPLVVLVSLYLATDWFFLVGFAAFRLAVALLIVCIALADCVRLIFGRTTARQETRLALPVVVLLVLYFGVLAGPHHAASPEIYSLKWGTITTKLTGLDAGFFRYGGRANHPLTALLAFCLLWPVRRELVSRRLLEPVVLEQIALAATFLGIYVVLPATYSGAAYADLRALPVAVLFILFAVLHLNPGHSRDNPFVTRPLPQVTY